MIYLIWSTKSFGGQHKRAAEREQREPVIRAKYNTLEEAKAQAEHDLELGRDPLRIEAEDGKVLWTPKAKSH